MQLTGLEVRVRAAEVDERRQPDESPREMTRRLALAKAKAVTVEGGLVLAADTVVVDGDHVLGKPTDSVDARRMLKDLRGRSHQVVTSIVLLNPETGAELIDTCESNVPMRQYSEPDLDGYLASGNPLDKAGGYGIQDKEFMPVDVDQLKDCYANVMGLPLCHLARNLPMMPLEHVPAACQGYTGYQCPIYSDVLEGTL